MSESYVLPDLLLPGLKVVFCGTAAGAASARRGAYYAGPGNKFWKTLYAVGLTPRLLEASKFPLLPQYGIGLTDIAKTYSGADSGLRRSHFDSAGLRLKIQENAPLAFAFNGKKAAQAFYGTNVMYGQQSARVGTTEMFVLPSTSGAASGFWNLSHWQALAAFLLAL